MGRLTFFKNIYFYLALFVIQSAEKQDEPRIC